MATMDQIDGKVDRTAGQKASYLSDEIGQYYSALFRNLRLAREAGSQSQAIGITSVPGCGKPSVIGSNLAINASMADSHEVLLINANPDNRVPEVTFGTANLPGFSELLHDRITLEEVKQSTNRPNLSVMGYGQMGPIQDGASCLIRFQSLLETMQRDFAFIVVDLPEASELTACFDIVPVLDGVVLEVESERVERTSGQQALRKLEMINANVLGCVVKEM